MKGRVFSFVSLHARESYSDPTFPVRAICVNHYLIHPQTKMGEADDKIEARQN